MSSFVSWLKGANFSIYACHFLASWSGRMWMFSLGVFLINIAPGSLQLSAAYGLANGASVLVFGTVVGDWVDRTPRLKAALISMIMQNSFVICCACVVFVFLFLTTDSSDDDGDELGDDLKKVFYSLITVFSVMSRLMKIGRVIVIERDWIIEIARSKETQLSVMTSTFRRIDLLTKIFAPMISGLILNYAGLKVGCVFISAWSIASLLCEYFLIRRVYNIVPVLKEKKHNSIYTGMTSNKSPVSGNIQETNKKSNEAFGKDEKDPSVTYVMQEDAEPKRWSPVRLLASFIIIYRGFRTYFSYDVKWAGLALASLYLTVLGFDGVTVGYATTQGLSSSLLGILMGVGAAFGICATFTYPYIVRRFGLARTGVLALGLQVSCLSMCVISVFLPGSPFDLTYSESDKNTTLTNCSDLVNSTTSALNFTTTTITTAVTATLLPSTNGTMMNNTITCLSPNDDEVAAEATSKISVYVMLAGIVTARFGLWTGDLTIIQLFLERVKTKERGVVNGFQSSLNQMMDFFKYALVAAIPFAHQFGLLIFISFLFICTGWSLMVVYCVNNWQETTITPENNDVVKYDKNDSNDVGVVKFSFSEEKTAVE